MLLKKNLIENVAMAKKKQKYVVGDVFEIRHNDDTVSYGRVIDDAFLGFYGKKYKSRTSAEEATKEPYVFRTWASTEAIVDGVWRIIGNLPLRTSDKEGPLFFNRNAISKKIRIWENDRVSKIRPTAEQIQNGEATVVWLVKSILQRLDDHFHGRNFLDLEKIRLIAKESVAAEEAASKQ